jgi:hypothetical protein
MWRVFGIRAEQEKTGSQAVAGKGPALTDQLGPAVTFEEPQAEVMLRVGLTPFEHGRCVEENGDQAGGEGLRSGAGNWKRLEDREGRGDRVTDWDRLIWPKEEKIAEQRTMEGLQQRSRNPGELAESEPFGGGVHAIQTGEREPREGLCSRRNRANEGAEIMEDGFYA